MSICCLIPYFYHQFVYTDICKNLLEAKESGSKFLEADMKNKQLQDILKQYPDECEIVIERDADWLEGDIVKIRVEYEYGDNFEIPVLTLEYKNKEL